MLKTFTGIALLSLTVHAAGAAIPIRTPIGSFPIEPSKAVTRVEMTRVDFLPGEQMPEHIHPVPVVCVVANGTFLLSIGAAPVRTITVGDTTIEGAGESGHDCRNWWRRRRSRVYAVIF